MRTLSSIEVLLSLVVAVVGDGGAGDFLVSHSGIVPLRGSRVVVDEEDSAWRTIRLWMLFGRIYTGCMVD